MQAQRAQYEAAVRQLGDPERTMLVLVSRPDLAALREAARAGAELAEQEIGNQRLVVNGLLTDPLAGDPVAEALAERQRQALESMPASLRGIPAAGVPLVALDLTGVEALRVLVSGQTRQESVRAVEASPDVPLPDLEALIDELEAGGPRAVLVMGKGSRERGRT